MKNKQNEQKSNILVIMADQLRYDALSLAGGLPFISTPNIEALAGDSLVFRSAYCTSPLCAPSRSAIASSLYPHRTGVLDNTRNHPIECPTAYQTLRKHGYRVSAIGKLDLHKPHHFYGEQGFTPRVSQLGFTDTLETEGKMSAAMLHPEELSLWERGEIERILKLPERHGDFIGPYQKYLHDHGLLRTFVDDYRDRLYNQPVHCGRPSVLPPEHYHDSFIGRAAVDYLSAIKTESPWHLFVSFVGPHDPWDAPDPYFREVNSSLIPSDVERIHEGAAGWIKRKANGHSGGLSQAALVELKRQYAGMIALIDEWVGRMISVLKERDLYDSTIIVFTSDHGEMLGDKGLLQKRVMYEAAIRVPLIIKERESSGSATSDARIDLMDLYPTLMQMSGIPYDAHGLDGISFSSILSDPRKDHRRYLVSEIQNCRCIHDGRYKYIQNFNDRDELYDLESDPHERDNIVESNEKLATAMKREYELITGNTY